MPRTEAGSSLAMAPGTAGLGPRSVRARFGRRGGQAAFERLYERHHQELYRYCLAILRNREDAEDAMQATMAAALRSLPGEKREVALRPWLFRVAHNESISLLRKRSDTVELGEVADRATASAEFELAERDRLRQIVTDLRSLPARQTSALVMRELSGLSYGEIAAACSCSQGAARQTVYEARVALRQLEEGRNMECESVRRAISDRDGRRLRGRKIRSHIDDCDGCTAFVVAIVQRRSDFQILSPALPAAVASAGLVGLLSGSGAGTGGGIGAAFSAGAGAGGAGAGGAVAGGAAGAGGTSLLTMAAVKGASILAAGIAAAGVADSSGLLDVPGVQLNRHAPSDPVGKKEGSAAVVAASGADEVAAPAVDGGDAARSNGATGAQGSDGATGAQGAVVRERDRMDHGQGGGGVDGGNGSQGRGGEARSNGRPAEPGRSNDFHGGEGSPGRSGDAHLDGGVAKEGSGKSGTAPGREGGASASGESQGTANAVAESGKGGGTGTGRPASSHAQAGPKPSSGKRPEHGSTAQPAPSGGKGGIPDKEPAVPHASGRG